MFKKKLVTLAAAVFCAALVTAEPASLVNKTTSGLIEDGAIDSFAFGNEEGKGIVFGQYDNSENLIELGWGNALSDTLWLSIFDGYRLSGQSYDKETVTKVYGTADDVNVDYVDESPRTKETDASGLNLNNILGVGVALNNKFGVQAVWSADWQDYKDAPVLDGTSFTYQFTDTNLLSSESKNSATGEKESKNFDNIKHYNRNNTIKFNFKGVGVEDIGDIAFYAKLNNVRTDLNFATYASDYTETVKTKGTKTKDLSESVEYSVVGINPGLEVEAGFNLPDWGIAKQKLSFTEDFSMNFDVVTDTGSQKNVEETTGSVTTTTTDCERTVGTPVNWTNVLTPKYTLDFAVLDQLTFKTQVSAAIGLHQYKPVANTYSKTEKVTTYDKTTGNKTVTKTTTTWGDDQYEEKFVTSITPKIDLGLVYQVIPGKFNLNFGVSVEPGAYSWESKDNINSNINNVTTVKSTNEYGTTTTTKTVTVNNGSKTGTTESHELTFTNDGTDGTFNIGATWFFTEAVKLDVYYGGNFVSGSTPESIFDQTGFGIECCVLF